MTQPEPTSIAPADPAAVERARRGRNIALALGLAAFVIIVFAVSVIRMASNVPKPHF